MENGLLYIGYILLVLEMHCRRMEQFIWNLVNWMVEAILFWDVVVCLLIRVISVMMADLSHG